LEQDSVKSVAELFSVGRIIASVFILLLAWLSLRVLQFITGVLASRFSRHRLQISGLFPLLRLLTWLVASYIVIVFIFRPQANAILALTASAGIAVGLAAQDVVRNVLSGVLILFDRPFRVGDMIHVGDVYGEVLTVGLRSVRVHTFDDSTVTLPNSLVLSSAVSNSNSGALHEMVVVEFDLPGTVDVQKVKELAWEAAASSPYVYLKKSVTVIVEDRFERTFLTRFKVKAYVLDVRLERVFASDVMERIKKEIVKQAILTESMVLSMIADEGPAMKLKGTDLDRTGRPPGN